MTAPDNARLTVLVVDDTPANLSLLSNLLREHYRVKVANSGVRALELASAAPPDMVLLDVMMPEMDGYEVCRRLKAAEATRRVPVIFLTARNEAEDEELGFAVGAVDFIHKPISPPIVLARIRTHLQVKAWQEFLQDQNAWLKEEVERRLAEVIQLDERAQQLLKQSEQLATAREALDQANREMALEIEQRKLLEEELRELATTDSLTGLFVRRQLFDLGGKEIDRARRNGAPLSLMILDIDHFKAINDTHGHAIGDEVLKSFSGNFRDSLRNGDIACRFGGEEFVAILPETDTRHAMDVAQRLRQSVESAISSVGGAEVQDTISVGLAELRAGDTSITQLINRADGALYMAKTSGRNRVVAAPETDSLLSL